MKKLSILFAFTLLLSGCTSTSKLKGDGVIPVCDQIRVGVASDKTLELPCLDGSTSINFHQIKGPIIINVWGSWCEGCRKEMPYFVDLYSTQSFKSVQIQLLGINVEENSPTAGSRSGSAMRMAAQDEVFSKSM